jgi:hypothetical protein
MTLSSQVRDGSRHFADSIDPRAPNTPIDRSPPVGSPAAACVSQPEKLMLLPVNGLAGNIRMGGVESRMAYGGTRRDPARRLEHES